MQGPGSELLKNHQAIGDSIRAAQALQQKHEEIESQHSVRKPKQIRTHALTRKFCFATFIQQKH